MSELLISSIRSVMSPRSKGNGQVERSSASFGEARDIEERDDDINYPLELSCPVCFNLLDDAVSWPSAGCSAHPTCRICLLKSAESVGIRCPICRAPPPPEEEFSLVSIWKLPVHKQFDDEIRERFPNEWKDQEQCRAPDLTLPLFEEQFVQKQQKGFKCGDTLSLRLTEPRHLLLLCTCLSDRKISRFALLPEGSAMGFIAGLVSHRAFGKPRSVSEAIASLLVAFPESFRESKSSKPCLTVSVLLVDTFQLAGPPTAMAVEGGTKNMMNKTPWRWAQDSKLLQIAHLRAGTVPRHRKELPVA